LPDPSFPTASSPAGSPSAGRERQWHDTEGRQAEPMLSGACELLISCCYQRSGTHGGLARSSPAPRVARTISALLQRFAQRSVVVEHEPFDDEERQSAVAQQLMVESTEAIRIALGVPIPAEQSHDLPLAGYVRDLLRRAG